MSRRLPHAPNVPRAVVMCGLVVLVLGTVVITGCGSHRQAAGFCATIQRGHAVFNSTGSAHQAQALAEFDRVAASAPASVAPDLKTISTVVRKPGVVVGDPALIRRYFASIAHFDTYLHETCGLSIPPPVKF